MTDVADALDELVAASRASVVEASPSTRREGPAPARHMASRWPRPSCTRRASRASRRIGKGTRVATAVAEQQALDRTGHRARRRRWLVRPLSAFSATVTPRRRSTQPLPSRTRPRTTTPRSTARAPLPSCPMLRSSPCSRMLRRMLPPTPRTTRTPERPTPTPERRARATSSRSTISPTRGSSGRPRLGSLIAQRYGPDGGGLPEARPRTPSRFAPSKRTPSSRALKRSQRSSSPRRDRRA